MCPGDVHLLTPSPKMWVWASDISIVQMHRMMAENVGFCTEWHAFKNRHLILGKWGKSPEALWRPACGFASIIALGCFHVGPSAECSGKCCASGCNASLAGKAQAGLPGLKRGPSLVLSRSAIRRLCLDCDLVSLGLEVQGGLTGRMAERLGVALGL